MVSSGKLRKLDRPDTWIGNSDIGIEVCLILANILLNAIIFTPLVCTTLVFRLLQAMVRSLEKAGLSGAAPWLTGLQDQDILAECVRGGAERLLGKLATQLILIWTSLLS